MKILAVIPARGGSKRLPGKNIKPLDGVPLIAWSIRTALASNCCVDVLVSTDDPDIAKVARDHGASVPWLRPRELATDTAGSVDVAIHALDSYEAANGVVDGLLLLQPTSPFRTTDAICKAVDIYSSFKGERAVVSVCPATSHPAWCFRTTNIGMEPFLGWDAIGKRSQDLDLAWMLNGSIYLASPAQLRNNKNFLMKNTVPIQMTGIEETLDIDNESDWLMAETLISLAAAQTLLAVK